MARICPLCGRANDDDANFCQGCGTSIGSHAQADPPDDVPLRQPAAPAGTPPAPPGAPLLRDGPRLLVVLAALLMVAIAGSFVLLMLPSEASDSNREAAVGPSSGATVRASPSPALDHFLAGAVGPKADRLAAIMADGGVKPITRFVGQQISNIAYSPDGAWLACIAGTDKRSDLWLFQTATSDARQPTADAKNIVAVESLAWLSPTLLLTAAYPGAPGPGHNANLLVYDTETGKFARLLAAGGMLRGVSVSASRDGRKIAFVAYSDLKTTKHGSVTARERLQVLDRASGFVRELGAHRAFFDVNARTYDEPLISPNGEAIIYRRARSDVGTSYTIVDTNGAVLMPEMEALMPAGYAWNPRGTKVVFTGQPVSGGGKKPLVFWQFDLSTGGSPRVLARCKNTWVQGLSWSPDGETIAWSERDRKGNTGTIYLMKAQSGASTVLVKGALSPVWSPDCGASLQTSPNP